MTIMNFDLEDGKQPISFTLNFVDTKRMVDFMAECTRYRDENDRLQARIQEQALQLISLEAQHEAERKRLSEDCADFCAVNVRLVAEQIKIARRAIEAAYVTAGCARSDDNKYDIADAIRAIKPESVLEGMGK